MRRLYLSPQKTSMIRLRGELVLPASPDSAGDARRELAERLVAEATAKGQQLVGPEGVKDVMIVCCDGLKGLPDAINTIWPEAIVQTSVLHLLRNTFRLAARQNWDKLAKDLRPIYTAVNETEARARFEDMCEVWCGKYRAIRGLWERAWHYRCLLRMRTLWGFVHLA